MPKPQSIDLKLLDASQQSCPLCEGISFEPLARNDRNLIGITTVGCKRCGLVQTNPRPSAEGLNVFYRDHYRLFYQGATNPDAAYIANLNKDVRLARTAAFFSEGVGLVSGAVILDYGCGEGSLFAALRKAGFTGAFYGVELNASFGEFASRYGNAIVSNTIRAPEPVDLVVVNHVLEHLADPIGTLKQLGDLLKPGTGRLYIDVPDAEEYSTINDLHLAHIYHFSERTLRSLVEKAGFTVLRVEKHAPPFHPRSVRLVASAGFTSIPCETSPSSEQAAWNAIRRSGRMLNTLRVRLRHNSFARQAYRLAKRLTTGQAQ